MWVTEACSNSKSQVNASCFKPLRPSAIRCTNAMHRREGAYQAPMRYFCFMSISVYAPL